METGRKIEQAFMLYQQRLEHLTQIMNQLHQIVKSDQVIEHLKDPSMEKYRTDRINEIVSEVMNSQKQKMLIRVLQKYQQLSKQLQQKVATNDSKKQKEKEINFFENLNDFKQKNEKQIMKLKKIIQQKNLILEQKQAEIKKVKQAQKIANLNKSIEDIDCKKCQKFKTKLKQIEQQKSTAEQFIQKLKKDGQVAVKLLNQKIKKLNENNEKLQQELEKAQTKMKQRKIDVNNKIQTTNKGEKIQVMRRQIAFLQQQLIQVQKYFSIVKDIGIGSTMAQIKKLKSMHKKFKQFYLESLEAFRQQNRHTIKKILQKLNKNGMARQQIFKPEKMLSKLNQLDNELDYFIENELLTE